MFRYAVTSEVGIYSLHAPGLESVSNTVEKFNI